MTNSEPILDRVCRLWFHPWPLSTTVIWILAALLAAYSAATIYLGALHTNLFGHDYFLFLDTGWRVLSGQRPYIDFHTAHGPILSLYSAFAMVAGAGNVHLGFGIARALATAAFTIWMFLLLRRRVVVGAALALCITIALMAGAPFALTSSPLTQSMAMFYNRFGYVLLALLMIEGFRPAPPTFMGGFSTGAAVALLAFLKINFFGASLGFLALSLIFRRLHWIRVLGIATGFLFLTLPFLVWLRFDVPAILYDLHALAAARSSTLPMQRFLRTLNDSFLAILLLLILSLIVTSLTWQKRHGLMAKAELTALALATITAELAVGVANQQNAVFALMSVCSILLLASLDNPADSHPAGSKPLLGAILLLGLCLSLPGSFSDLVGFANAIQHAARHRSHGLSLNASRVSSLVFEGDYSGLYKYDNGPPLVTVINDGLHLLRTYISPADRVLTLGYVNPFPACLGYPAPRNVWVFYYVGFNFADHDYQPASEMFAEADTLMVPRYDNDAKPTTDALVKHYQDVLDHSYRLIAASEFWLLYRKRSLAG